jgi:hypothetical protein
MKNGMGEAKGESIAAFAFFNFSLIWPSVSTFTKYMPTQRIVVMLVIMSRPKS